MKNCRRVRLGEWKQCPLGTWLDVDQLGSKEQTVPKHMATSFQIIQTWLKIVTTNLKHPSFPEGCSHLFLLPRLLFLSAWGPPSSRKVRGQSHQQSPEESPWNSPAVNCGINCEVSCVSLVARVKWEVGLYFSWPDSTYTVPWVNLVWFWASVWLSSRHCKALSVVTVLCISAGWLSLTVQSSPWAILLYLSWSSSCHESPILTCPAILKMCLTWCFTSNILILQHQGPNYAIEPWKM